MTHLSQEYSAHFLFYDNPVATFQAIGEFVQIHAANSQLNPLPTNRELSPSGPNRDAIELAAENSYLSPFTR
jgi:hypothetical protein